MLKAKSEILMAYVVGCFMACLSFLINKVLLKFFGPKIIISYSPLVEESAKTLFPYVVGADILLTHITFGFLEAGYDAYHSQDRRWQVGISSIVSHGLFGLITVATYKLSENIIAALMVGYVVHWLCNVAMVNLSS